MSIVLPAIRKRIEFKDHVPEELKFKYPRLHYCPMTDYQLINDDDIEFKSCECFYKDDLHWITEEETI